MANCKALTASAVKGLT